MSKRGEPMNKSADSNHIQIPTSVLKQFGTKEIVINSDGKTVKRRTVWKMDMDAQIKCCDIKDCNAQKSVYIQAIEDELEKVEVSFGETKNFILRKIKQKEFPILDTSQIRAIKNFFKLAPIRSPLEWKHFQETIAPEYDLYDIADLLVADAFQREFANNYNEFCLVLNSTTKNFIIPQLCWFCISLQDVLIYFIPISPNVGIGLYNATSPKEYSALYVLDNPIDVVKINRLAVAHEAIENKQAIYAKNKEDLMGYIKLLKESLKTKI